MKTLLLLPFKIIGFIFKILWKILTGFKASGHNWRG